jgi:tetratricopeptide (TPR) repeat protein
MDDAMRFPTGLRWALVVFTSILIGGIAGWHAHRRVVDSELIADARAAYEQGKIDLALRLAKAQLQESGGLHVEAARIVACSLASKQLWSEAAKAFEGVISTTPEDFSLHAKSLYHLGRHADAVNALSSGLKKFEGDPRLAELEARILATHGPTKEALASARRLVEIPGKEVSGRILTGMVHYGAHNYQLAAVEFRKALALSPTLEGQSTEFAVTPIDLVNEAIATSLLATENEVEAFEFARAAYDAKPNAERALLAAKGAAARKLHSEARDWLAKAFEFEPNNSEALSLAIDLALQTGDVAAARASLNRLETIENASPAVRHQAKVARARVAAAQRTAETKMKRK